MKESRRWLSLLVSILKWRAKIMESNFSTSDTIERFTLYPQIEIKELARALANVDPQIKNHEIPDDKFGIVNSYSDYLIRANRSIYNHLKSQGISKELDIFYAKFVATNSPISADILFSTSFILLEKDLTPQPIIEKCISCICELYKKHGEHLVFLCGGENAVKIAKANTQDRRGEHKKKEENASLYKIIGLLACNLSNEKSLSGSPKWINKWGKPSIEPLYNLLIEYAEKNGISKKGMGKSSFYDKLRVSLESLHDE